MNFIFAGLIFLSLGITSNAGCGKRPFSSRVVNGQNAAPHSWPWQISLRRNGYHTCGGSLIRPDWIVTAAHCVSKNPGPSAYTVVVGAHRRKGKTDVQQSLKVKAIHMHSGFSMKHLRHDIAVLQLERPVELSDKVATVCLPSKIADLNARCYITGWGLVSGWGPAADKLKQAKLPLRSDEDCKAKYRTLYDRSVHLCAGEGREGASGGCRGDSGGPFVCEMGGTWYLQGAVSFGMTRCTTAYPTVFTKIVNHVSWILNIIGECDGGGQNTPQPPAPQTPPMPTTGLATKPPRITTKPPPSGCRDTKDYCAGNQYFCDRMPSFRKDCPKTCNDC